MKSKGRFSRFMSWFEIAIAAILFFTMLITCGLYINIKMNGKISSLPSLPEKDKRQLLRAVASDSISYGDDLLEPVFVGFKNGESRICAALNGDVRHTIESTVYDSLYTLFSGRHENRSFENESEALSYIEGLKNSDSYMLISFFCDMPSGIFLPCISGNYEMNKNYGDSFMIKHLFLIPDIDENLYGVSVSHNNEINILIPASSVSYGKIVSESYDISDGYSYFEYLDRDGVYPVVSSSVVTSDYSLETNASLFGMDASSEWVNNLFDTFDINSSLVKSFNSGDKSETNHVDEQSEMTLRLDGSVVYTATDSEGIYLEKLLGYFPNDGVSYNNNDRIFAVKNIVNAQRGKNDLLSYSLTGIDTDPDSSKSVFFLKLFVDGISVSNKKYDAIFEFDGDYLTKAEFYSFVCKRVEYSKKTLAPQKYMSLSADDMSADVYCPMLCDTAEPNIKSVCWGGFYSQTAEVNN